VVQSAGTPGPQAGGAGGQLLQLPQCPRGHVAARVQLLARLHDEELRAVVRPEEGALLLPAEGGRAGLQPVHQRAKLLAEDAGLRALRVEVGAADVGHRLRQQLMRTLLVEDPPL
jgi:hypothetical protein